MFGSIQIGVDVVDLSLFRSGGDFGEVGGIVDQVVNLSLFRHGGVC